MRLDRIAPLPGLFTNFFPRSDKLGRMLFFSAVVGVVAGLGGIAFTWMLEFVEWAALDGLAGFRPNGPANEVHLFHPTETPLNRWVLFVLPALGGLFSGVLVWKFAPEAGGHGTDAAIESYHFRDGAIRARVPLIKALTSAVTIGTGGSAGSEGPIAQIGAGFGSVLATRTGLSAAERRTLMTAGMAAGIGAIFHAPLAGALFASEVLYKDMDIEHEVLVPAFISSILAYAVFAIKFGWDPLFSTPPFEFQRALQLLPYCGLAVVVAAGAIIYVRVFYGVHRGFARLSIPPYLKPALGGLLTGAIGLFIPQALATSYGIIQDAFVRPETIPVWLFLIVALAKMMTNAFTVGSGGSGGVFGPAIVIGGCLGGVFGRMAQIVLPGLDIQVGAFVLVGMAGFFSAAANCPISTIIMVSEVTGNYHLLVPSMLVCVLAYLLAQNETIYQKQLQSRLEAPSKMGNMLSAVLRRITVGQAVAGREGPSMVTIPEGLNLRQVIDRFSESEQTSFPVVAADGSLVGVLESMDIRRVLHDEDVIAELVVARDLAHQAVTLTEAETLLAALYKMSSLNHDELVVIAGGEDTRPVATLNRHTIMRAYDKSLFTAPS